ncbi:Uncharacterised protein [Escherichia coli]|uniref:Lipoprotein n=1 Tax=Escherichia coli TaxID=562 RepID=A0A2X3JPQ6_ECOLX|nr:Uncharacterised protein [Escherichia coli]
MMNKRFVINMVSSLLLGACANFCAAPGSGKSRGEYF